MPHTLITLTLVQWQIWTVVLTIKGNLRQWQSGWWQCNCVLRSCEIWSIESGGKKEASLLTMCSTHCNDIENIIKCWKYFNNFYIKRTHSFLTVYISEHHSFRFSVWSPSMVWKWRVIITRSISLGKEKMK